MPGSLKQKDQLSLSQPKKDDDLGRSLRSASPAVKRPASDMGAQEREDYNSDVDMADTNNDPPGAGFTPVNPDAQPSPDTKAKQQDLGLRHRDKSPTRSLAPTADPGAAHHQNLSDNSMSATSASESLIPSPSNLSSVTTGTSVPDIDDQIAKVLQLSNRQTQEGDKGYVVSSKWLARVQARSVQADLKNFDKSATEGEIGPVTNVDIAMVVEDSGKLLDQNGEPFVPLRPGMRLNSDYEIIPEEAWNLIISWYGIAKDSPIITRYADDFAPPDALMPQIDYELDPPIFSFLKVPSEHTPRTQREKDVPPPRMVASKKTRVVQWLRNAKGLLNIDMNTKVRVWRVLGGLKNSATSGVLTPAASRSASPAPGAEIVASAGDRMLLDVNTFAALRTGEDRELLDDLKDNTANSNYNGSLTLGLAGLGRDEVVVLEEQKTSANKDKEDWPSDHVKINLLKGVKNAAKGLTPSGRSSPAPGMMTRGRQKRDGRPRGITGLSNLGNTCYMNSALQCIRSVEELTQYFLHGQWKKDLNPNNPLGHHGEVAKAYANLLNQIYDENATSTNPSKFKATIGRYGSSFSGYQQQDSQEFLLFLLDGLQEDLNRIEKKPYIEKPDSTDDMVHDHAALKAFADKNWQDYKARNDSVITDLFAGMYKSTLTCPVCQKVSIIFDPFNNLTLQLPIENNWSHEILYFPLHKRPFRIDVDIDKHSTIKALKDFVAKRTGGDVERMLVAESYKNRIYKIFDNNIVISEANIQSADIVCVYELESVPTNYNPNKVKKYSMYTIRDSEDELVNADSPEADRLLVPVFHRLVKNPSARVAAKPFFGQPTYLVLTRADRASPDEVLRKILGNVAGMTTKKILDVEGGATTDESLATPEGSDTQIIVADDMSSSESNQPMAASVQGEDGLVDVSMRDASQAPESTSSSGSDTHPLLKPGTFIPPQFHQLFDITIASTNEGIPTGWNQITENHEYSSMSKRVPKRVTHRPAKAGALRVANDDGSDASSGDESGDLEHESSAGNSSESDDEGSANIPTGTSGAESEEDALPTSQSLVKSRNPKSRKSQRRDRNTRKGMNKRVQRRPSPLPPQPLPPVEGAGLVRPGEAIVLDWNEDSYKSLFGAKEDEADDFAGAPTWKSVELLPDAELKAKRDLRSNRKKNGITLEDCLNEFGKSETLSEQNAWYCPRCKEHRRADKMFELWKAPDILVMHLKRFSSNRNFRDKLEVRIEYPVEGLDLTSMVRDQGDGKSMIYDLIAVDNHYGGLGGGHYTAYAKNFFNNGWYEYNDSHTSAKSDPRAVVTSAAYLLFYRRRQTTPLGGQELANLLTESKNEVDPDSEEKPAGSRESSPPGEDQRLGDSSHNGLSSALHGPGRLVGVGGLAQSPSPRAGLSAEEEAPSRMIGPQLPDEQPPGYEESTEYGRELVMVDAVDAGYEEHWRQSWSFPNVTPGRVTVNSEDGGFDGRSQASNDSTRVEGEGGSPRGSLDALHGDDDDDLNDHLIYSDANAEMEEFGDASRRGLRESAPPPEMRMEGVAKYAGNDSGNEDDDDEPLPVMELSADPAKDGELTFKPETTRNKGGEA